MSRSKQVAGGEPTSRWQLGEDVQWTLNSLLWAVCLAFVSVAIVAGRQMGGPLFAAFASLTAGLGTGFLFGIPKILQSSTLPEVEGDERAASYRQQVNTNLTEISDWLTKIIVGLGLINLKEIPGILHRTAENVARGMNQAAAERHLAFATGVLVSFAVLGFLYGYLSTRLVLQGAFSRADREASGVRDELDVAATTLEQLRIEVDTLKAAAGPAPAPAENPGTGGPAVPDAQRESASTEAGTTGGDADPWQPAIQPPANPPENEGAGSVGDVEAAEVAGPSARSALTTDDPLPRLAGMAAEYVSIRRRDHAAQVRAKNDAATQMTVYARSHGVSRDDLVRAAEEAAQRDGSGEAAEGFIITLATLVTEGPEAADVRRLLRVAKYSKRLHVQYRVVLALSALHRDNMISDADRPRLAEVIQQYRAHADADLAHLLDRFERMLHRTPGR